jgi:hypothetical protein
LVSGFRDQASDRPGLGCVRIENKFHPLVSSRPSRVIYCEEGSAGRLRASISRRAASMSRCSRDKLDGFARRWESARLSPFRGLCRNCSRRCRSRLRVIAQGFTDEIEDVEIPVQHTRQGCRLEGGRLGGGLETAITFRNFAAVVGKIPWRSPGGLKWWWALEAQALGLGATRFSSS